jgi:hypothetical protein
LLPRRARKAKVVPEGEWAVPGQEVPADPAVASRDPVDLDLEAEVPVSALREREDWTRDRVVAAQVAEDSAQDRAVAAQVAQDSAQDREAVFQAVGDRVAVELAMVGLAEARAPVDGPELAPAVARALFLELLLVLVVEGAASQQKKNYSGFWAR